MPYVFKKVAIVGVGLIGSSIGLALRKRGLAESIVGIGRSASNLEIAKQIGAIDSFSSIFEAGDADFVVVCTPVEQIAERVLEIAAKSPDVLITDAGSTKATILADVKSAKQPVRFVGSHPLAGSEKSGARYGNADLFVNRTVVVTPDDKSAASDVAAIESFWRSLGAKVVQMSPEEHDRAVAMTSHLPHLVASAVAGATAKSYLGLTAGGWLDTTRVAAGDPGLWRQILLSNQAHVLAAMDDFQGSMAALRAAIAAGDGDAIERLLKEAKQIRDAVAS